MRYMKDIIDDHKELKFTTKVLYKLLLLQNLYLITVEICVDFGCCAAPYNIAVGVKESQVLHNS